MADEMTSKEKLKRYDLAALANHIYKDQSRGAYSLAAMKEFYTGLGVEDDDPIMNRAFAEAQAGIKDGQITNAAVFQAMGLYSEKFDDAYATTTVGDFVDYVADKGYDEIPDDVKSLLNKYKNRTVEYLEEEAKGAKKARDGGKYQELSKVVTALALLKQYVFEGVLYSNLVKENTKKSLEGLLEERQRRR